MPIINSGDLETNLYAEIITEITRNDNTITERAIDAAVTEAKMYLGRYDLLKLFGTADTSPEVADAYLATIVKDIACWHILRLSGSGVDYTVYRTAYLDAIASLKNIRDGQAQPEGWPYSEPGSVVPPDGNSISWNSNPRRSNFY